MDQSAVQSLSQNICVFSNFLNCGREPDARSSFCNPFHRSGAPKPNAPSPTLVWAMGWCNVNALAPRRQLFKPRGAISSAMYTGRSEEKSFVSDHQNLKHTTSVYWQPMKLF